MNEWKIKHLCVSVNYETGDDAEKSTDGERANSGNSNTVQGHLSEVLA